MSMPWKIAKAPTMTAATHSGGRAASATIRPSTRPSRDADLDAGQRHAKNTDHPAHGHHQRKHDRQNIDRRRAEECAPQPDRHHRRHMVGPEQRMRKPPAKPPAELPVCASAGDAARQSRMRKPEYTRLHVAPL